jgi:hypothetical protein
VSERMMSQYAANWEMTLRYFIGCLSVADAESVSGDDHASWTHQRIRWKMQIVAFSKEVGCCSV